MNQRRRESIERFMLERGLNVNSWCTKAGLKESTLRSFLNPSAKRKRDPSITLETLDYLAVAEGVSVSKIIGEHTQARYDPEKFMKAIADYIAVLQIDHHTSEKPEHIAEEIKVYYETMIENPDMPEQQAILVAKRKGRAGASIS